MGRSATKIPPLNKTDLIRLTGYSGARVDKLLKGVAPCEKRGVLILYDPVTAIRALLVGEESSGDRKERLQADVIEEKLRRMRGESLERKHCLVVWGDKLKRLSDTIRGIDRLSHDEKSKLCNQLRNEIERVPDELDQATFDDYDQVTEE